MTSQKEEENFVFMEGPPAVVGDSGAPTTFSAENVSASELIDGSRPSQAEGGGVDKRYPSRPCTVASFITLTLLTIKVL